MIALGVLVYAVPLFHVVPLKAARQQTAEAGFDARTYVDTFWSGPLHQAAAQAVDASELLGALRADPAAAAQRLGHRLGLSGSASYFVAGHGHITAVTADAVSIALQADGPAVIVIELGPIFGNAVRDGCGLLDVSAFPNAQDFNALSTEINRRVEEQVFPLLTARAAVGTEIRFVGGVEVADADGAPATLNVVPVVIAFP